jgi:hypothetical protein
MRGGGRLLGDTGHRLHRPPQDRARTGLGAPFRRAGYAISGAASALALSGSIGV